MDRESIRQREVAQSRIQNRAAGVTESGFKSWHHPYTSCVTLGESLDHSASLS